MAPKVISFNVKGLKSPHKRKALQKEFRSLQGDIVFLQETHFLKHKHPSLFLKCFSHIYMANAEKKKAGVLIAINDSLSFNLKDSLVDDKGGYLILICEIDRILYILVNVYAPNVKQMAFLKHVLKCVEACRQGRLLTGGDFNAINNLSLDTTNLVRRRSLCLSKFLHNCNLFDIWRCCHESGRDFSYFSTLHRSCSKIYMFLTDRWTLPFVTSSSIETITWLDHVPITLILSDLHNPTSSSIWRRNTSLLSDPISQTSNVEKSVWPSALGISRSSTEKMCLSRSNPISHYGSLFIPLGKGLLVWCLILWIFNCEQNPTRLPTLVAFICTCNGTPCALGQNIFTNLDPQ